MEQYFKAAGDDMFIPEKQILRLFKSRKNGRWYVTLPDWTNVEVENERPHELKYYELLEARRKAAGV